MQKAARVLYCSIEMPSGARPELLTRPVGKCRLFQCSYILICARVSCETQPVLFTLQRGSLVRTEGAMELKVELWDTRLRWLSMQLFNADERCR